MKYKGDLPNGYVNGYYVGLRQGSPTPDKLEPQADGYGVQHSTQRQGTVTADALKPGYPAPDTGTKGGKGNG
ncbi:hypothetical protein M5X17_10430 [Paenibacillus alvei]|uniref:hypothetical protein n=1 Tax=Paenibacillus alvei TaxID=44250 RepID=UPI002281A689|nr:hypothetical protein [Paenibacillus alvei]MCY9734163.1 hypothetical protein [Paenibacillus alvei]